MEWSNVSWFLTGLGAVVVLLTRVRLGGSGAGATGRASGVAAYSSALLRVHTVVGIAALGLWIVALVTRRQEIALVALVAWWVLAIVGLLLLARWLPSGGRHSEDKATDAWGEGAGLSVLGHLGTVIGVAYFTFVVFTQRL